LPVASEIIAAEFSGCGDFLYNSRFEVGLAQTNVKVR
jgi:hypothetical protein